MATVIENSAIEQFIARWRTADGTEKANYQLFLTEICQVLELPRPDPADADTENNAYVFERRVDIRQADGRIRLKGSVPFSVNGRSRKRPSCFSPLLLAEWVATPAGIERRAAAF